MLKKRNTIDPDIVKSLSASRSGQWLQHLESLHKTISEIHKDAVTRLTACQAVWQTAFTTDPGEWPDDTWTAWLDEMEKKDDKGGEPFADDHKASEKSKMGMWEKVDS